MNIFMRRSNMSSHWISPRFIPVITEMIYVMRHKVTSNYDKNIRRTKKGREEKGYKKKENAKGMEM